MGDHAAARATQVRRPWRTTIRTVFQMIVTGAAATPLVLEAVYQRDPGELGGAAGVALAVSTTITRVMALPVVERFLQRFIPFLAAEPAPKP